MKRIVAVCAATLALAVPATASTIVANGSFEHGVPGDAAGIYNGQQFADLPDNGGGWDIYSGLSGDWTSPKTGVEVQTERTLGIAAQDGTYYLELDTFANSSITQAVALSLGSYVLSFWYHFRTGDIGTDDIRFTLGTSSATESILGGDVSRNDPGKGWTKIVAEFDVFTAGDYYLSFFATGKSEGLGGLIDNVSIDAQPSQVPVPAAGLLLLGALGGLGALRRRKA